MKIALPATIIGFALVMGATGAMAACVTKGAVATAGDEASAKWFAMETMVQAVDVSLWPNYVMTSKVDGYKVEGQHFKCHKDVAGVTCDGRATFCKIGK